LLILSVTLELLNQPLTPYLNYLRFEMPSMRQALRYQPSVVQTMSIHHSGIGVLPQHGLPDRHNAST